MSIPQEKPTDTQIEQVESVHSRDSPANDDLSFKEFSEKDEQKKKNIFIRFKDSIYSKPEKTQNAWHLLTNLTNTQRITFAAGKSRRRARSSFYTDIIARKSLLWVDIRCL